jgi:hypothetical protein
MHFAAPRWPRQSEPANSAISPLDPMDLILQFSDSTLQFSDLTLQFSDLTLQFSGEIGILFSCIHQIVDLTLHAREAFSE